jgi:hypothetical protein
MKKKREEWNADTDKSVAQAECAEADAQLRLQQQLDELKASRYDVASQLRELQNASTAACETTRQGAEAARVDMVKAFKDAPIGSRRLPADRLR